jgi:hypothetical protein
MELGRSLPHSQVPPITRLNVKLFHIVAYIIIKADPAAWGLRGSGGPIDIQNIKNFF